MKRATAQEELFDAETSGDEPEAKVTSGGATVHPIGAGGAARDVKQAAGKAD